MNNTRNQIEQTAMELGREAFEKGMNFVPATNSKVDALIAEIKTQFGFLKATRIVCKAYTSGWTKAHIASL